MKFSYDGDGDTLSILLSDKQIHHAEEHDLLIVNFDEQNRLVEIEIPNASKVLGGLLEAIVQAKPGSKLVEVKVQ
ncbi:MAG: DUF2283 domain-containing protein [Nitrososphaerales archaeon]